MSPPLSHESDSPRWTDGYRTLIGPFRHEPGWRLVLAWPTLREHRDFPTWREAQDEHAALIAAWTDPDIPAMADPDHCPTCDNRGWHTAGGNDPMPCGRCEAGEAHEA